MWVFGGVLEGGGGLKQLRQLRGKKFEAWFFLIDLIPTPNQIVFFFSMPGRYKLVYEFTLLVVL